MWTFGIPSSLKAWIDHVVRAGKTFNYVGGAVEGLAKGKKAILVLASGGIFSDGARDNISPRARVEYYPGYYAADVFDPDGYSFEVVHKSQ